MQSFCAAYFFIDVGMRCGRDDDAKKSYEWMEYDMDGWLLVTSIKSADILQPPPKPCKIIFDQIQQST